MNRNVLIGLGLVAAGIYLTQRAKSQGKIVPVIGKFIPSKAPKAAPAKGEINFSGYQKISREWEM